MRPRCERITSPSCARYLFRFYNTSYDDNLKDLQLPKRVREGMEETYFVIRASAVALVSSVLLIVTSVLSVILTYAMQSNWRKIDRVPFISDAHYDNTQSPIFSAMTAVVGMVSATTVVLTFLTTESRRKERFASAEPTPNVQNSPNLRLKRRRYTCISRIGLSAGIAGFVMLVIAAATYTELSAHFITIGISSACITIWMIVVCVTLPYPVLPPTPLDVFAWWGLVICTVGLFISMTGFAIGKAIDKSLLVAVVMEYVGIGSLFLFLILLSYELRSSVLLLQPRISSAAQVHAL